MGDMGDNVSMKMIFALVLLLFPALVFAQTCDLTLKDSPEIRGLKLGMTKKEVEKVFPSIDIKPVMNIFKESDLSKLEGFENLKTLDIFFNTSFSDKVEPKITNLLFVYKNDIEWNSINEFAQNLSDNLNLPFEFWKFSYDKADMNCKDFRVEIRENFILLKSLIIENKIKEYNEKKKKEFKP